MDYRPNERDERRQPRKILEAQNAIDHSMTVLGDLDGPFHVAGRWKSILLNGLDENYFQEGVRIVKTITPEELQELAIKYLDPAAFFELVVV